MFGYDNVDILGLPDANGKPRRSHVEFRINEREAEVVRKIFRLYAQGKGLRGIAKQLNQDQVTCPCPRPAMGKPKGWVASSIRPILFRQLYTGVLVWNKTRKRNTWGQKRTQRRPESEWLTASVPHLRILTDQEWAEAHTRLSATRATYLRRTNGQLWGRPSTGIESKYLLTGMGQCATCGGSLYVRSRHHGTQRAMFYGCRTYHDRGQHVCANSMELPLREVDRNILATIEADVLQPDILEAAIQQALKELQPSEAAVARKRKQLAQELASVETALTRLTQCVSA